MFWILLLGFIGLHSQLHSQSGAGLSKASISLTANPAYFVLGGYHIKSSYHFPKRWSIGLTIQGGFELPEIARDQFFNVTNEAIAVEWAYAIGAELKYRFSDASFDKGLVSVIGLGYEGWKVYLQDTDEFENWFLGIDLGYNWYPFGKQRFHVGVNYSLIFILNNTDARSVGGNSYNLKRIVLPNYIPSILIGWRF